jgi:hypothetical protein
MTHQQEVLDRLSPILFMAQLATRYATSCERLLARVKEDGGEGNADMLLIVTTAHQVHCRRARRCVET